MVKGGSSEEGCLSDIYVVGFQELVELNTSSVYKGKDVELSLQWETKIIETLFIASGTQYIPVLRKTMVGQYILLLVKPHLVPHISNLYKLRVMTGFKGMTGNKGAVSVRFDLYGKSLLFTNVHLDSG